jgi:UDP-N-acetylglucosamine--N-acetylmuramyl-(pentapeptide) pyrophosphoryl-undecaprenol N-acetylglucosamine transferase
MPKILFTGGGTAGHVTPNIALIEETRKRGWLCSYVGSLSGIEHDMIAALDVPFHGIASGKLRRYFSWQNFIDPLFVVFGFLQSLVICLREKPDVVFSKGGFVSVPVVAAAWLLRIPVISHESDVSPGLANRLAYPFCRRICVTFEETRRYLPGDKVVVAGTPIRASLLNGDVVRGREYLGFDGAKDILLVFGGSLGARVINEQLRSVLPALLEVFDIVHVTGNDNVDDALAQPGYVQKEFIREQFGDVLAAASLVVSRAGANSLYELFVTRKPHLLVPLTLAASRGDQIENAAIFEARGFSRVVREEALSDDVFTDALFLLRDEREEITRVLENFEVHDSVSLIMDQIQQQI